MMKFFAFAFVFTNAIIWANAGPIGEAVVQTCDLKCENNGTCDEVTLKCVCSTGFTGLNCETKLESEKTIVLGSSAKTTIAQTKARKTSAKAVLLLEWLHERGEEKDLKWIKKFLNKLTKQHKKWVKDCKKNKKNCHKKNKHRKPTEAPTATTTAPAVAVESETTPLVDLTESTIVDFSFTTQPSDDLVFSTPVAVEDDGNNEQEVQDEATTQQIPIFEEDPSTEEQGNLDDNNENQEENQNDDDENVFDDGNNDDPLFEDEEGDQNNEDEFEYTEQDNQEQEQGEDQGNVEEPGQEENQQEDNNGNNDENDVDNEQSNENNNQVDKINQNQENDDTNNQEKVEEDGNSDNQENNEENNNNEQNDENTEEENKKIESSLSNIFECVLNIHVWKNHSHNRPQRPHHPQPPQKHTFGCQSVPTHNNQFNQEYDLLNKILDILIRRLKQNQQYKPPKKQCLFEILLNLFKHKTCPF